MSISASSVLSAADTTPDCRAVELPVGIWALIGDALTRTLAAVDGNDDDVALARHHLLQWIDHVECADAPEGTVGPPIGTIITSIVEWLGQDGYLPMRGGTFQQADYAYLASGLPAAWRDDGAGTFTLPDLTGYLIAGAADGSELGDIQPAGPVEDRHIEQIMAPVLAREQATAQTHNSTRGVMYTRSTTGTGTAYTLSVGVASPDPISDILPTIRLYYHIKFTL